MSISDIMASTSVLVMLSGDACSPCYTFENNRKKQNRLSPEDLRDILLWATNVQPTMPELFFLVGADEPLNASAISFLEDMGDRVITPLLPIENQESLGIPFSRNQTVVAHNLNELVHQADNIAGRPVILHVERVEIGRLAEGLLSIQDFIGTIRLCLRDIQLLEDHDLQTYEQQLANIADIGLMKQAVGTEVKFRVLNLSALSSDRNRITRCPAGMGFITIGPDGFVYPCSAFYHAGKESSIGSISSIADGLATTNWKRQQCDICGSAQCPGCPFLESSDLAGKEQICKVYEAENRATKELLPRVVQSGYLFDCLRTLKARECATKSQREGGEGLIANEQVHDITFEEFIKALKDLKLATESLGNDSFESGNYKSILNRWSELPEVPPTSQKNIFRRRVQEILTELEQLRHLASAAKQNRSLTEA